MEQEHACDFAHSCCNPGERVRLPGTAHYYCRPHFQLFAMPSHGGMTAGELAGSRAQSVMPRVHTRQRWSLGIASTGSWL